jgi:hypothetical protein
VETLAEASVVFEAGWMHNNVAIGLLILPIFVLVTFVGGRSIGVNPYDPYRVWVATGNVD